MENKNGFWIDSFNNKWATHLFDEIEASEISSVLNHARNLCKRKNAYSGRTNVSLSDAFFYLNEEEYECDY